MTGAQGSEAVEPARPEHFDVLIVGAGLSGVGGAYHLTKQCPGTSFLVLEAMDSFGGTWLTHKYPGVRSDSDLYTYGYRFKPWTGPPIATGTEILAYIGEVIAENDLGRHIRYRHRISAAQWSSDKKLALIPGGDLFRSITSGKVSVVTDEIDRFTEKGVLLKSGDQIAADVIVTATGFNLSVLGDIDFVIDGAKLNLADTVTYHGVMFTGVPNMAWVFGYLRESWTMRSDLVSDFVCRLLNHMKDKGVSQATPALRPEDKDMALLPWIDPENFNPGYLMRGMHLLPKRGAKKEWSHTQDYWTDKDLFPAIDLDDGALAYA